METIVQVGDSVKNPIIFLRDKKDGFTSSLDGEQKIQFVDTRDYVERSRTD